MIRPVALMLAVLLAAPVPAEAASACLPMFAFLCRKPVKHRVIKHVRKPVRNERTNAPADTSEPFTETTGDPKQAKPKVERSTGSDSCEAVLLAFSGRQGSRDDFVRTFPPAGQRRILECLGDAK